MKDKLVILAEHSYERALLIQSRLENEGIDAFLSNVNMISSDVSTGVKIIVKEKDMGKALKIYRNFIDEIEGKDKHMKKNKVKDNPVGTKKNTEGIKKILVPVDFSDYSRHAAHFALYYALQVNAEILLLHAYYSPDLQAIPYDETFGFEGTLTEYLNDLKDVAQQEIKNFTASLKKTADEEGLSSVMIDYSLLKGSLEDVVLYACESYKPDLIIMGARGKDQRKNDPIGSTTTHILAKAPLPILVIPEDAELKGFFERKKIIYATDYDEADFQAIKKLIRLMKPFDMEIVCMHIGKEEDDPSERVKMEGLRDYFKKFYREIKVSCSVISHEDVITGIDEYVSANIVSAIALTTHKRNLIAKIFNPSVTRKMFYYTRVPLLVFHS